MEILTADFSIYLFSYYNELEKIFYDNELNFIELDSISIPRFQFSCHSIEEAKKAIKESIRLGPPTPLCFYSICKILTKNAQLESPAYELFLYNLITASYRIGRHEEVKKVSDNWLKRYGQITDSEYASKVCKVIGFKAKAHRNLGEFEEALNDYRNILGICQKWDLEIERAFQLLMFGKMYGNYGGQQSLFRLFTELALQSLKEIDKKYDYKNETIKKYLAIAYDSLGQIHGRSETHWRDAIKFYKQAFNIHYEIYNDNGLSRVICHECIVRATYDRNADLKEITKLFHEGVNLAVKDVNQERGIAVRKLGYVKLLIKIQEWETAQRTIIDVKNTSRRLRDYRTFVRACLEEINIVGIDPQHSYQILSEAQHLAKQFGLLSYELEVNQALLKLIVSNNSQHIFVHHSPRLLLNRAKEIISTLKTRASDVHRNLSLFNSDEGSVENKMIEFRSLSFHQKAVVLVGLVQDFEWITEQGDKHFHSLVQTLEQARLRESDLSGMTLGLELTQAILHDFPNVLSDSSSNSDWNRYTNRILLNLEELRQTCVSKNNYESFINEIKTDTQKIAQLLDNLIKLRQRIKADLIAENWQIRSQVSLLQSAKKAIENLKTESPNLLSDILIKPYFECDITIFFYPIWIERVLENLIRNAAQHVLPDSPNKEKIKINIKKKVLYDPTVNMKTLELELEIANLSLPGSEKSLENAFRTGTSERPDGHGVGVRLASLIFHLTLNARIRVEHDGEYTCLKIFFNPDGGKINIVPISSSNRVIKFE